MRSLMQAETGYYMWVLEYDPSVWPGIVYVL